MERKIISIKKTMTKNLTKYLSSFTIVHRICLILVFVSINERISILASELPPISLKVILFWLVFLFIYLTSRCLLRWRSKCKRRDTVERKSNQVFVISSNQFGSFRPSRSDSLFSNLNFASLSSPSETIDRQPCQTSLLEHYLKTYNPLQIDWTTSHGEINSLENFPSETDTQTIENCYSLSCTNKQSCYSIEHYRRLRESSGQISLIDEPVSDSTSSTVLPIFMITDCSNNQRLHTVILEEE